MYNKNSQDQEEENKKNSNGFYLVPKFLLGNAFLLQLRFTVADAMLSIAS